MKKPKHSMKKPKKLSRREALRRLKEGNPMNQPMGTVHSSLAGIAESRKRSAKKKETFSPTAEDAAAFGHRPLGEIGDRLMEAFCRGYDQKDKQRGEDYLTILNHLAEGTYDPRLMTKEGLAECLGWMQREHGHMVEHMNEIHSSLALVMTESLVSQMEKGLFKKGRRKCG